MSNNTVKTRFAPSPTGFLHIGGLRTALFNYLWAKKNNGIFALRIEDTDQERKVDGAEEQILEVLNLFGLDIDEGPIRQSECLEIYQKYADELIKNERAYREDGAIRQKIPKEGNTIYQDMVYGKIKVENHSLDEGVLIKSDGFPTYNFANVVDDHEMGVTHVLRGSEFVTSTAKHILLYQSLGWQPPEFAHLPVIVNEDGKKLSKRDNASDALTFLDYFETPTILNFIALLGWNPKTEQEIFSKEELIQEFDIKKINKSNAVFDNKKLNWLNKKWATRSELVKTSFYKNLSKVKAILKFESSNEEFNKRFAEIVLERASDFFELEKLLTEEFMFFVGSVDYKAEDLLWKESTNDSTKKNLSTIHSFLQTQELEKQSLDAIESTIKTFIQDSGLQNGEVLWPLRVALSGLKKSPSPFEIIYAFLGLPNGREEVLNRIKNAIEKL